MWQRAKFCSGKCQWLMTAAYPCEACPFQRPAIKKLEQYDLFQHTFGDGREETIDLEAIRKGNG